MALIKILFILPTLKAGGAERVLAFLSQNLDPGIYDPELIVIGFKEDSVYSVDKVKVRYLNKSRVLYGILPLIRIILIERPNIAMSSIGHVNLLMGFISIFSKGTKFIIREASVSSIMKNYVPKKNHLPFWLIKYLNKQIDAVVCQSKDMAVDTMERYKISRDKIYIINNPATPNLPLRQNNSENSNLKLITIGRISGEKGYFRLLDILSQIQRSFEYTIIGNGPDKVRLFEYAASLNLTDKIDHIPFTREIGPNLVRHDLFLQGSFVEGFPNALLESAMCGLPAIAFNAPGGTKEIIENGVNGFLVNSEQEFISHLNQFTIKNWDPEVIRESVQKKFDKNIILAQYEKLFQDIVLK